jgi:hypothetical protein
VSGADAPEHGDAATGPRTLLRVVSGDPTPEELAALVAVVGARSGAGTESEPAPPSRWASRAALLRRPLLSGPGAWRASGLPS